MKDYKLPPVGYYLILIAFIAVVVVLSFTRVSTAVVVLAIGLIVHAVARLALPEGAVPQVRSAAFDTVVCALAAILLLYFASWGDTPQIW